MKLGERIKIIILECGVTQVEFAAKLGVSAVYISHIVTNKKNSISNTLAKLIEETYGYSAEWILYEKGEKYSVSSVSATKLAFIKKIQAMPDEEVEELLTYANYLKNTRKAPGQK